MWLASGDVPNCSLSLQTFLNPWYVASLVPIYIITFCMGIWAFFTAGGSFHNILKCLSCKQEDDSRVMMYSALQVPFED